MAAPARSAAIQIVRPTETFKGADTPEKAKKDATQRLCRNVLIYGSCRFQDQGCAYYHPLPGTDGAAAAPAVTAAPAPAPSPAPATPKSSLNPAAATYATPENNKETRPAIGAEHLAAPVFVPKTPITDTSPQATARPALAEWTNAPSFTPPVPQTPAEGMHPAGLGYDEGLNFEPGHAIDGMYMGGPAPMRVQLDQHLYTAPLPHVATRQPMHSFFIPDDLRRMIHARQEATYANPGISAGLPSEVHVYHSLVPLGNPNPSISRVYHHPAPVYRANSTVDGNVYALRRIEGFKLSNEAAFSAVEAWRQIRHANIVGLREAFTNKAFNDNSLVIVYDFHPNSTTIADEWLSAEAVNRRRQSVQPIPERIIWSYVIQIANALKAVHTAGLAVRTLDATKVLITGKNRIRINGVGILDVLAFDSNTSVHLFQQDDLLNFGQLLLSLCCDFLQPGQHFAAGLDYIGRAYSLDLKQLVGYLLGKPTALKTIDEVLRLAGPRILNELDAIQTYNDVLENDLGAEVENGRIARLLTKLGFINERPEFEMDPQWSESGDRYVLKLFRDYVFHQVGPDGKPVLDLSHVLTTLNKLDAGARSREKIMLVSRDSQSCLVVEYRDIYKCIESAYSELRSASKQPHHPRR
ncbi:PAN2-PAN3 deadenylation complex subunit PAN3 [Vanrija pseudolonga]|uniref:PAN2-PAN3 deadenylation complex subunit PAN3 n=1 Tax=Vanrija pseudolonga TaxID=143232 RepID=A0AAF1BMV1_9TREE|nr:PAN2-PAN3 deadenylation complex subunit PAN3 [Vanrija pseudolonga]